MFYTENNKGKCIMSNTGINKTIILFLIEFFILTQSAPASLLSPISGNQYDLQSPLNETSDPRVFTSNNLPDVRVFTTQDPVVPVNVDSSVGTTGVDSTVVYPAVQNYTQPDSVNIPEVTQLINEEFYIGLNYTDREIQEELGIRQSIIDTIWPNRDLSIDVLTVDEVDLVSTWAALAEGGLREIPLGMMVQIVFQEMGDREEKDGGVEAISRLDGINFNNQNIDIDFEVTSGSNLIISLQIQEHFQDFSDFSNLGFMLEGLDDKDYSGKKVWIKFLDKTGNEHTVTVDSIDSLTEINFEDFKRSNPLDWTSINLIKIEIDKGGLLEGSLRFKDINFTKENEKNLGMLTLEELQKQIQITYESGLKGVIEKLKSNKLNPLRDRDFIRYMTQLVEKEGNEVFVSTLRNWQDNAEVAQILLNRPLFYNDLVGSEYYWNVKDEAILAEISRILEDENLGNMWAKVNWIKEYGRGVGELQQILEKIMQRQLDLNLVADYAIWNEYKQNLERNELDASSIAQLRSNVDDSGLLDSTREDVLGSLKSLRAEYSLENSFNQEIKSFIDFMEDNLQSEDNSFDILIKYTALLKASDEESVEDIVVDIIKNAINGLDRREVTNGSAGLKRQLGFLINKEVADEFKSEYRLRSNIFADIDTDSEFELRNTTKELDSLLSLAILKEKSGESKDELTSEFNRIIHGVSAKIELERFSRERIDNELNSFDDGSRYWNEDYVSSLITKTDDLTGRYSDAEGIIKRLATQLIMESYLERPLDLESYPEEWILNYWLGQSEILGLIGLEDELIRRRLYMPDKEEKALNRYFNVNMVAGWFDDLIPGFREEILADTFLPDGWIGGPLDMTLDTLYAWRNLRLDVEMGIGGGRILDLKDTRDRPLLDYFGSYLPFSGASNDQIRKFILDKVALDPYLRRSLASATDLSAAITTAGYSSFWVEAKSKGFTDDEIKRMLITIDEVKPLLSELFGPPKLDSEILDMNDKDFLIDLARKSFNYFLATQDEETGLFQDALRGVDTSTATTGFGLTALVIGAENGWISREEAMQRVLKTLNTYLGDPNDPNAKFAAGFKGLRYHYYNGKTALRAGNNELSTVDTSLLLQGALTAGEYFGGEIKDKAQEIYEMIDWETFLNKEGRFGKTGRQGISMAWKPEGGFMSQTWDQYTGEGILTYLLAIGSPTHNLDPEVFSAGFTRREGVTEFGFPIIHDWEGALFTHQYSFDSFDFRNKEQGGLDFFRNSILATLNNIFYGTLSSQDLRTYGLHNWGPSSMGRDERYTMDFGIPPSGAKEEHDGTISTSAPGGSIIFTPSYSIKALRNIRLSAPPLWGEFGFKDSYNLERNFFSPTYFGLGQGIMLNMLANFLFPNMGLEDGETTGKGLIWNLFMQNPNIQAAMDKAGFEDKNDILIPDEISSDLSLGFESKLSQLDDILSYSDKSKALGDFDTQIIQEAKTEGDFRLLYDTLNAEDLSDLRDLFIAKMRIDEVVNIDNAAKINLDAGRHYVETKDEYLTESIGILEELVNSSSDNFVKAVGESLLFVSYKMRWMYDKQNEVIGNLAIGSNSTHDIASNIIVEYFKEEIVADMYRNENLSEDEYKAFVTVSLFDQGVITEDDVDTFINLNSDVSGQAQDYINTLRSTITGLDDKLVHYVKETMPAEAEIARAREANEFLLLEDIESDSVSRIPWLESYLSKNREFQQFDPDPDGGVIGYFSSLLVTQGMTLEQITGLITTMDVLKPVVEEVKKERGEGELDLWNSAEDMGLLSYAVKLYSDGLDNDQIKAILNGELPELEEAVRQAVQAQQLKEELPTIEESRSILSSSQIERLTGTLNSAKGKDSFIWRNIAYLVQQGLDLNDLISLKQDLEGIESSRIEVKNLGDLEFYMNWGKIFASMRSLDENFELVTDQDALFDIVNEVNATTLFLNPVEDLAVLTSMMREGNIDIPGVISIVSYMEEIKPELDKLYEFVDVNDQRDRMILIEWAQKGNKGYSVSDIKQKIAMFNLLKDSVAGLFSQNNVNFNISDNTVNNGALKEYADVLQDLFWSKNIDRQILEDLIRELPKIEIIQDMYNLGSNGFDEGNVSFKVQQGLYLRYRNVNSTNLDFQNREIVNQTFKILATVNALEETGLDLNLGFKVNINSETGIPNEIILDGTSEDEDIHILTELVFYLREKGLFDIGHFSRNYNDTHRDLIELGLPKLNSVVKNIVSQVKGADLPRGLDTKEALFIALPYLRGQGLGLFNSSSLDIFFENVKNITGDIGLNLNNSVDLISVSIFGRLKSEGIVNDSTMSSHKSALSQNSVLNDLENQFGIESELWDKVILPQLEISLGEDLSMAGELNKDKIESALVILDVYSLNELQQDDYLLGLTEFIHQAEYIDGILGDIEELTVLADDYLKQAVLGRDYNSEIDSEVFRYLIGEDLPQLEEALHRTFNWPGIVEFHKALNEIEIDGQGIDLSEEIDISFALSLSKLKAAGIISDINSHIEVILSNSRLNQIKDSLNEELNQGVDNEIWAKIIIPEVELRLGKDITDSSVKREDIEHILGLGSEDGFAIKTGRVGRKTTLIIRSEALNALIATNAREAEVLLKTSIWAQSLSASLFTLPVSLTEDDERRQDIMELPISLTLDVESRFVDAFAKFAGRYDLLSKSLDEIREANIIDFSNLSYWLNQVDKEKGVTIETVIMSLKIRNDFVRGKFGQDGLNKLYRRMLKILNEDAGQVGYFATLTEKQAQLVTPILENLLNKQELDPYSFALGFKEVLAQALISEDKTPDSIKTFLAQSGIEESSAENIAVLWFDYVYDSVNEMVRLGRNGDDAQYITLEALFDLVSGSLELGLLLKETLNSLESREEKVLTGFEIARFTNFYRQRLGVDADEVLNEIGNIIQHAIFDKQQLQRWPYLFEGKEMLLAVSQIASYKYASYRLSEQIDVMSKLRSVVEDYKGRFLNMDSFVDIGLLSFYAGEVTEGKRTLTEEITFLGYATRLVDATFDEDTPGLLKEELSVDEESADYIFSFRIYRRRRGITDTEWQRMSRSGKDRWTQIFNEIYREGKISFWAGFMLKKNWDIERAKDFFTAMYEISNDSRIKDFISTELERQQDTSSELNLLYQLKLEEFIEQKKKEAGRISLTQEDIEFLENEVYPVAVLRGLFSSTAELMDKKDWDIETLKKVFDYRDEITDTLGDVGLFKIDTQDKLYQLAFEEFLVEQAIEQNKTVDEIRNDSMLLNSLEKVFPGFYIEGIRMFWAEEMLERVESLKERENLTDLEAESKTFDFFNEFFEKLPLVEELIDQFPNELFLTQAGKDLLLQEFLEEKEQDKGIEITNTIGEFLDNNPEFRNSFLEALNRKGAVSFWAEFMFLNDKDKDELARFLKLRGQVSPLLATYLEDVVGSDLSIGFISGIVSSIVLALERELPFDIRESVNAEYIKAYLFDQEERELINVLKEKISQSQVIIDFLGGKIDFEFDHIAAGFVEFITARAWNAMEERDLTDPDIAVVEQIKWVGDIKEFVDIKNEDPRDVISDVDKIGGYTFFADLRLPFSNDENKQMSQMNIENFKSLYSRAYKEISGYVGTLGFELGDKLNLSDTQWKELIVLWQRLNVKVFNIPESNLTLLSDVIGSKYLFGTWVEDIFAPHISEEKRQMYRFVENFVDLQRLGAYIQMFIPKDTVKDKFDDFVYELFTSGSDLEDIMPDILGHAVDIANPDEQGYLSFWAKQVSYNALDFAIGLRRHNEQVDLESAREKGLEYTRILLDVTAKLKPLVEAYILTRIDSTISYESGIVSYWVDQVFRGEQSNDKYTEMLNVMNVFNKGSNYIDRWGVRDLIRKGAEVHVQLLQKGYRLNPFDPKHSGILSYTTDHPEVLDVAAGKPGCLSESPNGLEVTSKPDIFELIKKEFATIGVNNISENILDEFYSGWDWIGGEGTEAEGWFFDQNIFDQIKFELGLAKELLDSGKFEDYIGENINLSNNSGQLKVLLRWAQRTSDKVYEDFRYWKARNPELIPTPDDKVWSGSSESAADSFTQRRFLNLMVPADIFDEFVAESVNEISEEFKMLGILCTSVEDVVGELDIINSISDEILLRNFGYIAGVIGENEIVEFLKALKEGTAEGEIIVTPPVEETVPPEEVTPPVEEEKVPEPVELERVDFWTQIMEDNGAEMLWHEVEGATGYEWRVMNGEWNVIRSGYIEGSDAIKILMEYEGLDINEFYTFQVKAVVKHKGSIISESDRWTSNIFWVDLRHKDATVASQESIPASFDEAEQQQDQEETSPASTQASTTAIHTTDAEKLLSQEWGLEGDRLASTLDYFKNYATKWIRRPLVDKNEDSLTMPHYAAKDLVDKAIARLIIGLGQVTGPEFSFWVERDNSVSYPRYITNPNLDNKYHNFLNRFVSYYKHELEDVLEDYSKEHSLQGERLTNIYFGDYRELGNKFDEILDRVFDRTLNNHGIWTYNGVTDREAGKISEYKLFSEAIDEISRMH